MNRFVVTTVLLIIGVCMIGCSKKADDSKKQQSNAVPATSASSSAVAGVHWTVPQGWTPQPERPMRAATYAVPAPKDGIEAGECGIFYFGNNQGGNVNDNLSRWISQFETGGKHEFSAKDINGLKTTLVQISGTYLAPSGPAMESKGKKDNYRLLGAIVEAPQGLVFFKFTGPEPTVTAAESSFNQLVNSIAKDQATEVPR